MPAPYTVCELLKKARSIYACIQVLAAHGVTLPPPAPPAAAPAAAAVPEAAAAPAAQPAEGAAAAATPSEGKLKPVPLHDMPALQKRKCLSIIKAMCCAGYNDHNTHTHTFQQQVQKRASDSTWMLLPSMSHIIMRLL